MLREAYSNCDIPFAEKHVWILDQAMIVRYLADEHWWKGGEGIEPEEIQSEVMRMDAEIVLAPLTQPKELVKQHVKDITDKSDEAEVDLDGVDFMQLSTIIQIIRTNCIPLDVVNNHKDMLCPHPGNPVSIISVLDDKKGQQAIVIISGTEKCDGVNQHIVSEQDKVKLFIANSPDSTITIMSFFFSFMPAPQWSSEAKSNKTPTEEAHHEQEKEKPEIYSVIKLSSNNVKFSHFKDKQLLNSWSLVYLSILASACTTIYEPSILKA
ncbi:uncharacterized protein BT62DRAFT_921582 [Guyanagaster necrorhizus]|uniref:Uncharacterized protein n=1 Tax=Guyanagaster necrorhizus TaxID=856835 RepID=A0A9P8AQJ9_9AGAR|nr:uncharacterized protein BT62DRAFT_921582 [Guyanagaster necrorhizus MCA 3950]KAG7443931.1 hypothetical protein BT62DRAFT_921582 [Guyanagaster necrorhizus MCA 3950]